MKIRRKRATKLSEVVQDAHDLRVELLTTSLRLSLFSRALDREVERLREEEEDADKR